LLIQIICGISSGQVMSMLPFTRARTHTQKAFLQNKSQHESVK